MLRAVSNAILFLAITAGTVEVAQAQWCFPCFDCCYNCGLVDCGCASTCSSATVLPPLTTTQVQPVISTQYRQQQQITYRDVAQTEYRQEAYYKSVPVTTYENVTVDEGSYQRVWVPKLVNKTVAKQGYQSQLSYRSVPYQVTRRIPEVTTQLVPEQRISYQSSYTTSYTPPLYTTYNANLLPPLTTPIVAAPPATPIASSPVPRRSLSSSSLGPVPDPEFDEAGRALPVPRRAATSSRYDDYRPARRRSSAQTAKKFVPAPSAAAVWQTPRGTVYR